MEILEPTQATPLRLGDTTDDDAQVLDSLVQSEHEPPEVTDAITPALAPDPVLAKRPTRLIAGTISIPATWLVPTLLLPEDLNRISLMITVDTVAPAYVEIGDNPSNLVGRIYLTPEPTVILPGHTGAVWVSTANASAVSRISYWAVTL